MLRDDLQNTLKNAMKEKNMLVVGAVRMIIAGLKEKDVEARGKGKEKADDTELLAMMQTMIKQRTESAKIYLEVNRPELAEKEQAEIKIIEVFLPKQLTDDEVKSVIEKIIASVGATSIKDMGKVMASLKADYAGQLDFGKASSVIKSLLS
ncbi:MAG: GatB/YqeY domain-containing protein [Alphaproteobacteria bacterium]|nr:GatB/YqeY domain-containing protein [Alphaproteobacteria bacterium]